MVKKSCVWGVFFAPAAPIFARKNGHTFVARIWPQKCAHFSGPRRDLRPNWRCLLRVCARNLAPLCGATFFAKKRGPGVKKNTRHVAHLMHQEMNSFSCEVHTGGGVEDGTRDGNFRKSSHQRRSPGSCLTAPMYRPRSRQHSEAMTASSVADSSMFASRSGAPFPRSGQRLEASIV